MASTIREILSTMMATPFGAQIRTLISTCGRSKLDLAADAGFNATHITNYLGAKGDMSTRRLYALVTAAGGVLRVVRSDAPELLFDRLNEAEMARVASLARSLPFLRGDAGTLENLDAVLSVAQRRAASVARAS